MVHFSETFKINNPAAWHNDLNAQCQYCGNPNLATVMLFKNNGMKPQHMYVVAKMKCLTLLPGCTVWCFWAIYIPRLKWLIKNVVSLEAVINLSYMNLKFLWWMYEYFEDSKFLEYWAISTGQQLPVFPRKSLGLLHHEDVGTMILWNASSCLPVDKACPRQLESSATLLWEPEVS